MLNKQIVLDLIKRFDKQEQSLQALGKLTDHSMTEDYRKKWIENKIAGETAKNILLNNDVQIDNALAMLQKSVDGRNDLLALSSELYQGPTLSEINYFDKSNNSNDTFVVVLSDSLARVTSGTVNAVIPRINAEFRITNEKSVNYPNDVLLDFFMSFVDYNGNLYNLQYAVSETDNFVSFLLEKVTWTVDERLGLIEDNIEIGYVVGGQAMSLIYKLQAAINSAKELPYPVEPLQFMAYGGGFMGESEGKLVDINWHPSLA